jgi:hypothetical protein
VRLICIQTLHGTTRNRETDKQNPVFLMLAYNLLTGTVFIYGTEDDVVRLEVLQRGSLYIFLTSLT